MTKLSHKNLLFLPALLWFLVGAMLLQLGIKYLLSGLTENLPLYSLLRTFTESEEVSATIILTVAILLGYAKAKFVLQKTITRMYNMVSSLPNPAPITEAFGKGSLLFMVAMMGLGRLLHFLPADIHGAIDIAVGAALLRSSVLQFRLTQTV